MQKVRSHPCGLLLFVCMRFQDLFHSPPGVLFAFPSQYWFAIGRLRVFSLGGWSPHLRAGFHVSRSTSRKLSTLNPISRTGLSPSVAGLSRPFQYRIQYHLQALPISLAALFLQLLRCFSSLRSPLEAMYSLQDTLAGEFPHSDIRGSVLACQLPTAFRRLRRPSSPVIAKASTTYT